MVPSRLCMPGMSSVSLIGSKCRINNPSGETTTGWSNSVNLFAWNLATVIVVGSTIVVVGVVGIADVNQLTDTPIAVGEANIQLDNLQLKHHHFQLRQPSLTVSRLK